VQNLKWLGSSQLVLISVSRDCLGGLRLDLYTNISRIIISIFSGAFKVVRMRFRLYLVFP
jgi:hypothetical protein